ncbi:hypothetical protein BDQ12DRAFT_675683 [Crucibulum laeve]|uniref:Autophagy-related protein 29 n=1 Tax=Crucibulum laeve TaxID=68775 RepID=A0A5C3MF52_9AGAR|nr:hypothetical protein BDQ12DRAFT_675683 [Crucibulum laeve]
MPAAPSIRVVIRLPYNRPENPLDDPPKIEWTPEKADILWKVIERSRASDSGGADWKGLAAHLEVPLPYLLYRLNARLQEDIRGLKDIQGALSPSTTQTTSKPFDDLSPGRDLSPISTRFAGRFNGSSSRLSSSSRLTTPIGVRARLNSLGNNSPRPKKTASSSTLTVQAAKKAHASLRPSSPSLSEDETDSEDDEAIKEDEADRTAEEQEALDRKLQDLQRLMTSESLGLVSNPRAREKRKSTDRGRHGLTLSMPKSMTGSFRRDGLSSQSLSSRSASQSMSNTSSPQGSIPDMSMSPPPDSVPQSPISRHMSSKSSSPPAVSPRSAMGRRFHSLVDRSSEHGSSHGSEASSFSDISDASISASALESALMSNMSNVRGNGSRVSHFARNRFIGRS